MRDREDWLAIQKAIGAKADAWPGQETVSRLKEELGLLKLTTGRKPADKPLSRTLGIPNPDMASMVGAYGSPGDESNLVRFKMPFPMRLYSRDSGTTLNSHRCHRECRKDLEEILAYILEQKGHDWIVKHGVDVYAGCFNYRKTRGGSALSKHAWGVAIDLNPHENRNRQKWSPKMIGKPGWANMPLAVVEAFEKRGWKSGGRAWGRDAMHFQRTR